MEPCHPAVPWLQQQGFSRGLVRSLVASSGNNAAPRIWVLDNSVSMHLQDARLIQQGNLPVNDNATRWQELQECVAFHVEMASRFGTPIRFSLLNNPGTGPKYFGLNQSGNLGQERHIISQSIGSSHPNGAATLASELRILREYVASIESTVRSRGDTVAIIIATQGLPTNEYNQTSPVITQEFVNVLQSFANLPVSVTMRMCSNDDQAIHFYNTLDSRLQFRFDVLDDWFGEALEVYLRNPWITYALALHRFRESGLQVELLDSLDERLLTLQEAANLCEFLMGEKLPNPTADWPGFLNAVDNFTRSEQFQWNPIYSGHRPWIDLHSFKSCYAGNFRHQTGGENLQRGGNNVANGELPKTETELKRVVTTIWAAQPPQFSTLRSIEDLLETIDTTFCLVSKHSYFQEKFHPFVSSSLRSGMDGVLKRAVRKTRFFLHPDKLPQDFDRLQMCLCKLLWDDISAAWDARSGQT